MQEMGFGDATRKQKLYMKILQRIQEKGSVSRVELAAYLHMTRASVTLLIHEMIEKQLLEEIGSDPRVTSGQKGRRKVLLDINPTHWFLIGIYAGHDCISIGLTTLALKPLEKQALPPLAAQTAAELVMRVTEAVNQILQNNCLESSQILGLGVGIMPELLKQFAEPAKTEAQRLHHLQQAFAGKLPFPISVGNALPSMASFCLHHEPSVSSCAFFCVDTGSYYLSVVHREQQAEQLYTIPISLDSFCVSPNGSACPDYPKGSIKAEVSYPRLKKQIVQYYSPEQTPVLYRLTEGNIAHVHFGMLFSAAFPTPERAEYDVVLRDITEQMVQKFCLMWNNILQLYPVERLYLHGPYFTEQHLQQLKTYSVRYLGEKTAAKLACSGVSDRCRFVGGIFYAIAGGCQSHFKTENK